MKKNLLIYLMVCAMLLSVLGQAVVVTATSPILGMDVSSHQGRVDWDKAANQIDFAILRCGYGRDRRNQDDTQWYNNADACTRLGIPFGAYIYSHATTEEAARSEAYHTLRLVDGYDPSLPIYLDLEDDKILQVCTPEQILKHATIFCDIISAAGYTPGIYANTTWWEKYLTSPQYDLWERWVAQYSSKLNYNRPYNAWQFTDSGKINGVEGKVDLNYWYGGTFDSSCAHQYTCTTVREASCTTDGKNIYTCSLCGNSFEDIIPAYGHSYHEEVVHPTCSEGGYTMHKCSCGNSYVSNFTQPNYHHSDGGVVTLKPTEQTQGQKLYSCVSCGRVISIVYLESVEEHMDSCPSAGYEDVPPYMHWAHEGIDLGLRDGLFRGVSEDRFDPNGVMTRAMIVTALWRLDMCPMPETAGGFKDVAADAWYAQAVAWAWENGIINGVGDDLFDPMGRITREQFATILYRYEQYLGGVGYVSEDALLRFADENAVSSYARDALAWAVAYGIITGTVIDDVVLLNPCGSATRAQAATILCRLPRG